MKKIYIILLSLYAFTCTYAQSDNCSGAVALTIGSCVTGSPGATQNLPGCVGNADDDAWYKFTATQTSHLITVTGSSGYDAVIQLLSGGTCGSLSSLNCVDNTLSGQAETINATGLTIGVIYYLRIYDYYAGTSAGTFTTCVTLPPTPPGNNNCSGAKALTVNGLCVNTSTTSYGATQSMAGCSGNADDDVWFMFTANNYTQTIQVASSAGMDAVVELFSGTCGSLSSIICQDVTFSGGTETINASGLAPGTVYYVRVYDYYSTGGFPFSICITGAPIVVGTQPNDEPCNAIHLPTVTADCNYLSFSNVGATLTGSAPSPTNCLGGTGVFGATTQDVWFSITVPASGNLCITPQPNLTGTVITDGVMALYSGSCASLTQITCSDDADGTSGIYDYPGTANDFLPYINQTGLTPGSTVYLRYWGWAGSDGAFGLCVQAPTNDACANALYICDLNGYSASTSPAYTPDRPGTGTGQMYANNETTAGVNQTDGTNTGGPFGYYPSSNVAGPYSSPAIDVNIENNSWIRFTAGSVTANLRVTVGNCWVGAYPSGGIQMQVFSGTNCNNFLPVSSFKEGSNTFTVTANGLTVGNDYYLMVDGYASDICNYTIQVLDGVALPAITAVPDSICPGQSSLLTAPLGATGYTWYPSGSTPVTTRTISVSPGTTMTYTCIAGGVCGQKQTLTKTVYVKTVPTVAINAGAAITTCGTQTITLTGSGANTYTWSTGSTATSFTTAPVSSTTYSLIGKASNGCTNTAVSNVTVNPIPNITIAGTNTICFGQSTTLTASGGISYTWTPGGTVASSITVNPTTTTVYNVTGVNAFGCSKTVSVQVVVNALPTVTSSSVTICSGKTGTLTAGGASTYSWSTGATTASMSASPAVTTTYTVTGKNVNNCSNTAIGQVSVVALPIITVPSATICQSTTLALTASGANTYTWSTSQNGPSISVTPTVTTTYTVNGTAVSTCSNSTTVSVTVNTLPQLSSTPSVSPSNCGASTGSITNVSVTGAPVLSYTWTNGASTNVGSTPNLNSQPAGTYNLKVKDGNGCTNNFGPYSITNPGAPAAPTASATINSICVGQTINLNAGTASGGTYNWSGPSSFTSTTQNPTLPNATTPMGGVYSVYITASGCSGPATNVTVTVNPLPTPNASSTQTAYCVGNTINLFASSAASYTWTGPGSFTSTIQNPSITNASTVSAGTYTLQVNNASGCSGITTITIGVNANPTVTASANPNVICVGNTINLNSGGGTTYSWSGPNGFSNSTQNPSIPNAGSPNVGDYTVTVTNGNLCSSTAIASVTIVTLPSFTMTSNAANICYGGSIQFNAGSGPYTYSWNGPNSYTVANSTNPVINNATPLNSGTYTVTASAGSCSYSQTLSVNVYPQIIVNASATNYVMCSGSVANLAGTGTGIYAWTGPNNFSTATQNPQIPNVQANAGGIYTLTITDATTNCSASDTVSLTISPAPSLLSLSGDSTCYGQQLHLNASFGNGVTVNWYSDAALTNLVQANSMSYQPTPSANGTYTYYVQGGIGNCKSTVTSITGQFYNINAIATADVYTGDAPLAVNFTGSNSTGVTSTDHFSWVFGDNTGTSVVNPNHIFTSEATYTVVLTVTDVESGCMDTATVIIKVEDDFTVIVPNVFTPNGDGANDFFHVNVKGAKTAEGLIYNRWGQLLYSWDVLNASWDGVAANGEKCPDATYYYLIKVVDKKDKEHLFPGYALIIR